MTKRGGGRSENLGSYVSRQNFLKEQVLLLYLAKSGGSCVMYPVHSQFNHPWTYYSLLAIIFEYSTANSKK